MNVLRTKRILRVAFGCTAALGILIVANAMQFAETSVVAQPTELYGVEAARAHAAQYADPNYFTQPAVVDIYQDIFLGRPTSQTNASYTTGDGGPYCAAERQTVRADRNVSTGHTIELPVQVSGLSQTPTATVKA